LAYFIQQGTWFYEVGFILYPLDPENPVFKWDKENHNHIMLVTGSFCWHIMFIIIGLILQLAFMKQIHKNSKRAREYFENLQECDEMMMMEQESENHVKTSGAEGGKYFTVVSDDEEDVQFDTKLLIKQPKDQIKLKDYKEYRENSSGSSSTSGNHSANLI